MCEVMVGSRVKARRRNGELQIYSRSRFLGYVKAIHGKGSRRDPQIIHVVFDDGIEAMVPLSRAGQPYVITCNDPPPPPLQITTFVCPVLPATRTRTAANDEVTTSAQPSAPAPIPEQATSTSVQPTAPAPIIDEQIQDCEFPSLPPLQEPYRRWLTYVASLRLNEWPSHLAT